MVYLKKESALTDHCYITLILRLYLNERGELGKSELIDTSGSFSKRFLDRKGLHQELDDWLNRFSKSPLPGNQVEPDKPQNQNSQTNSP